MKKLNAEKMIVILAIVAIAAGIAYSYYLHSIGQFGN